MGTRLGDDVCANCGHSKADHLEGVLRIQIRKDLNCAYPLRSADKRFHCECPGWVSILEVA